jgi:hypothetical protein
VSGPAFFGPLAVATKKFTTAPGLKKLPVMVKLDPTRIGDGTELMAGEGGLT